jgi:hypothetical protein
VSPQNEKSKRKGSEPQVSDDERTSLAPLEPEEALRALLKVKPNDKLTENEQDN